MLLFVIYKIVASTSPITYQWHMICVALAAFYTTGMTVALMSFVLEPLDCLLQSVNTAGKKHSNCCEEGGAPGQDVVSVNNFHEFNCTTDQSQLQFCMHLRFLHVL